MWFIQHIAVAQALQQGPPATLEQALLSWIPGSVLGLTALGLARMWIMQLIKRIESLETLASMSITKDQFAAIMAKLDTVDHELQAVAVKLAGTATNDGLGRMGDRMDGRITNVTERVAVLEATSTAKMRRR